MTGKKNKLKIPLLFIFLGTVLTLIGLTSLATTNTQTKHETSAFAGSSDISIEQYCVDGYYKLPTESKICSRAPNCGGYNYDSLDTDAKKNGMTGGSNSHNVCMGEGADRASGGCAGYVPACCYEMARTGDFTKCIGYWERLWCAKSQCDEARTKGASDSQCGGSCDCSSAHTSYCGEGSLPIPIAQRLGITVPTNTQAPQATATPQPQPTSTVPPNQPTSTVPPNQPTSTPAPINSPIPTNQQPTSAANIEPSYNPQPTNPPLPTSTPYIFPTIEIKSPKELAREVINPQNIQKLNRSTEKVFNAPKEGLIFLKQADQTLERTANSWIARIQIFIENLVD